MPNLPWDVFTEVHPEIDWETMTTIKGMNHRSQLLLDAIRDAYLKQHIDEPTRYRYGQTPHILDLLLTSEDNSIRHRVPSWDGCKRPCCHHQQDTGETTSKEE